MTTTPTHEYETVEGTKPVAHGVHEPRTVKHVTNDDLFMMTEIGDGTFVQWGSCRRCTERVGSCKCPEGPQEPPYIKDWRNRRFEKDLNTRPDPSYDLIPSLITWLEERGYDVTKSVKKQLEEAKPYDSNDPDFAPIDLTDEEREDFVSEIEHTGKHEIDAQAEEDFHAAKVDEGLDAALEKVKAAKADDDFPDF